MRKLSLLLSTTVLLTGASVSQATLFAYEGFDSPGLSLAPTVPAPDQTDLNQINASGTGFVGAWTVVNGNNGNSKFTTTGLSYPASYPGIFAPAGGSAINEALPDVNQNSQFRLNLASPITDPGSVVYVSWLGKRNGAPATAADGNNGLTPGKYADNPYPRPSGVRFLQTASGNSASGNIEWSSSGNPLSSTHMGWGAWAWNDTHGLMPAGTPDAVDVVDFVVVRLDYTTSRVTWWVNPQLDGSSDGGPMSFIWTDGGTPKVMNLYAFGTEAGSGNAERSPGSWQFDEIRVASTFEEAAGFVPEPSTYAAVLGLLAMGFVWMRRRRK